MPEHKNHIADNAMSKAYLNGFPYEENAVRRPSARGQLQEHTGSWLSASMSRSSDSQSASGIPAAALSHTINAQRLEVIWVRLVH